MKIAIVGGIGSGKSEVLAVAKNEMRLPCLSADEINAQLLQDRDYIGKIAQAFPSAVSQSGIDRTKLASIIFSDDEARLKLNSIAHPLILEKIKSDGRDMLVVEMPLLLESGAKDLFDEIIYVKTPLRKRFKFLKSRGMSHAESVKRIRVQAKPRELKRVSTREIVNDGDINILRNRARSVFVEVIEKTQKLKKTF